MIFFLSFVGAVFWFIFMLFLFYVKQSPEAQLRRRLNTMIAEAESERTKQANSVKETELHEEKLLAERTQKTRFYMRYISPIFDKLDKKFQKFAPGQIKFMLEEKLFQAGKTGIWSLQRIISFWTFFVLLGTSVGLLITYLVELHYLQEIMIVLTGTILGAVLPILKLNSMIKERQKIMLKTLPEFLDLLCVSVQAGLSFDGAISKITARMKGPLTDEFKRFQNDISLGMTRQYALNQVANRCNLEEMYLFISSIIQAEKFGTSMGRILKIQSDNMRDRHRQRIKAEALKAPIKILFPMVIFIFPPIFIVLLFPPIYSFVRSMGW